MWIFKVNFPNLGETVQNGNVIKKQKGESGKGRERGRWMVGWVVIMPSLYFPHQWTRTPPRVDECRRLFSIARSMKSLSLLIFSPTRAFVTRGEDFCRSSNSTKRSKIIHHWEVSFAVKFRKQWSSLKQQIIQFLVF